MNKNKSKAAYTTKWLNRHTQFWYEKEYFFGSKVIVITKKDAPKIVLERVKEINDSRVGAKQVYREIRQLEKQQKQTKNLTNPRLIKEK